jgi:hypothetical protein
VSDKPESYRPANGTEGDCFMASWCRHCARDKAMREGAEIDECDDDEICQIIGNTQAFDTDHPEYPIEWIYKDGQPVCTAFIQAGEPIPLKDDLTVDMFGGEE